MIQNNGRRSDRIGVILFLLLCLIPSVGAVICGPSAANANEIRSPLPKLITDAGTLNTAYFSGLADWFDDRFQLRPQLSTAWAKLNAALLRTSVEEGVLLGSGDWLYYADSLPDFTGEALPEETLVRAADRIQELQEYCSERGMKFLFTVAPNKNSLYPEHMPERFPKGESSNAERLYRLLAERRVSYIDLHEVFRERIREQAEEETEDSDFPLYFRTDSHWTARGAALAADTVLATLGKTSDFFGQDFVSGKPRKGDLHAMLYPSAPAAERDSFFVPDFHFTSLSSTRDGEAIRFSTECAAASGRLFCWRDSFGNALYPFLAESFAEATFSRENPYDSAQLDGGKYDTVLVEIVERNISWLAQ